MSLASLASWDTDFFGLRIARVHGGRLTAESGNAIDNWCSEQQIDLCVLLADAEDETTAHTAVRHQYSLIDFRVTLETNLEQSIAAPRRSVRFYRAGDLPALVETASEAFTDSRFVFDPYFPKDRVAEMYEVWLRRRCGDLSAPGSFEAAQAVLVAESDEGAPAGFLTCMLVPEGKDGQPVGLIDLVAVSMKARGQQSGESMVNAALKWFAEHGCRRAEVITQGRNVSAQRLYLRNGFIVCRSQAWYHKWFRRVDKDEMPRNG